MRRLWACGVPSAVITFVTVGFSARVTGTTGGPGNGAWFWFAGTVTDCDGGLGGTFGGGGGESGITGPTGISVVIFDLSALTTNQFPATVLMVWPYPWTAPLS